MASDPVLVTGATGFIGRHLLSELAAAGWSVTALSRSASEAQFDEYPNVTVVRGDISNEQDLAAALNGCRSIINLAGIAHVDSSDTSALNRVNRQAPQALFRLGEAMGLERMVHVSSALAEDAESGLDDSAYARSKLDAERKLKAAAKNSQLELTLIRPANVYGAGMRGNLADMIRRIRNGRMPRLPRTSACLSMIGVSDLVKLLRIATEKPEAAGKTYTVTDGVEYRLDDLEAAIYEQSGRKRPAWHTPRVVLYAASSVAPLLRKIGLIDSGLSKRTYRNLVTRRTYSNAAVCAELGFSPGTDFYRELPRILHNMEQQGAHNPT